MSETISSLTQSHTAVFDLSGAGGRRWRVGGFNPTGWGRPFTGDYKVWYGVGFHLLWKVKTPNSSL